MATGKAAPNFEVINVLTGQKKSFLEVIKGQECLVDLYTSW